jgi:hypothetical protein
MEYSKFTHAVITYVTPCFFPNSGNFFLILANLRDLDASMDGPTKKCPRCRKENIEEKRYNLGWKQRENGEEEGKEHDGL